MACERPLQCPSPKQTIIVEAQIPQKRALVGLIPVSYQRKQAVYPTAYWEEDEYGEHWPTPTFPRRLGRGGWGIGAALYCQRAGQDGSGLAEPGLRPPGG